MKKLAIVAVLVFAASLVCAPAANADTWVYVGSYHVYDGAVWTDNPPVMSAREAAAFLFGGSFSDYAISIDPFVITHTAHLDGWGDTQYLGAGFAGEDYSLYSSGDGGYNNYPSFSALVCDHAACAAYGYPANGPGGDYPFSEADYTNYVWRRAGDVPEPGSLMLLGSGLIGLGGVVRRKVGL